MYKKILARKVESVHQLPECPGNAHWGPLTYHNLVIESISQPGRNVYVMPRQGLYAEALAGRQDRPEEDAEHEME